MTSRMPAFVQGQPCKKTRKERRSIATSRILQRYVFVAYLASARTKSIEMWRIPPPRKASDGHEVAHHPPDCRSRCLTALLNESKSGSFSGPRPPNGACCHARSDVRGNSKQIIARTSTNRTLSVTGVSCTTWTPACHDAQLK